MSELRDVGEAIRLQEARYRTEIFLEAVEMWGLAQFCGDELLRSLTLSDWWQMLAKGTCGIAKATLCQYVVASVRL